MRKQNSEKKSGPIRDARGRLRGGNPGNSGGKKGRSGRKPLAFKRRCAEVLHENAVWKEIKTAARDRHSPNWVALLRWLAEYGEGLPPEEFTVDLRDRRDHALAKLLDALDRIDRRQRA